MKLKIMVLLAASLVIVIATGAMTWPVTGNPMIPRIPSEAIQQLEHELSIEVVARGHVTAKDGTKIPLIRFVSKERFDTVQRALEYYVSVYRKFVSLVDRYSDTGWPAQGLLLDGEKPRVILGLAFQDTNGFSMRSPAISQICLGSDGRIGILSIDPKTDRYDDIGESSLRELFAEELASDKGK